MEENKEQEKSEKVKKNTREKEEKQMTEEDLNRDDAWALLCRYNKDHFHRQHALTMEGVMRWYANDQGYGDEADFWAIAGMLHDLDFEQWPQQHCVKEMEMLKEAGYPERLIHAVGSHGYAICCDVKPEHQMEKVLYASDELSGLIGACALVRPSHSVQDMEVKSVKKKYKKKDFAAGCSREVIERGAEMLSWDLDTLIEKTILAMRSCEDSYLNVPEG